jgi:Protein of unknown function (DUF3489)
MAKSHSVDEPRSAGAVERTKRQRRSNAKKRSERAKAPKRQTHRKSAVRPRSRLLLRLNNRPASQEGTTIEELQAATGWQQHSVRGFLAGGVKIKLGLTLLSEKPDAGPRRYRIANAV